MIQVRLAARRRPRVERVSAAEVRCVRAVVLRPGQPKEALGYEGDEAPGAVHLGCRDAGRLVATASVTRLPFPPVMDGQAWCLCGVATLPSMRGRGLGSALVSAAVRHVATHGGGRLWCSARLPVVHFYRRYDLTPVGTDFDAPWGGRHVFMSRLVGETGRPERRPVSASARPWLVPAAHGCIGSGGG